MTHTRVELNLIHKLAKADYICCKICGYIEYIHMTDYDNVREF